MDRDKTKTKRIKKPNKIRFVNSAFSMRIVSIWLSLRFESVQWKREKESAGEWGRERKRVEENGVDSRKGRGGKRQEKKLRKEGVEKERRKKENRKQGQESKNKIKILPLF